MKTLYHVTARANVGSILEEGLRVDQCGINPHGFDFLYSGNDKKSGVIHLTDSFKSAKAYCELMLLLDKQSRIKRGYQILVVTLDESYPLVSDPDEAEEEGCVMCTRNIPSFLINLVQPLQTHSPRTVRSLSESPPPQKYSNNCFYLSWGPNKTNIRVSPSSNKRSFEDSENSEDSGDDQSQNSDDSLSSGSKRHKTHK